MAVKTRWLSQLAPPDRSVISVEEDGAAASCEVLHPGWFKDDDELAAYLRSGRDIPRLIVVESAHREYELIRDGLATPMDELCLESRLSDELDARLARLLSRHSMKPASVATDQLTGVTARPFFLEMLRSATAMAAAERPVSVVLFDLDHFKAVNDALGHATGDTVLKSFAELLEEGAKGLDCVSRIGGEEFAVFAWLTEEQAVAFAEFIRQETARANLAQDVEITVSAGISTVYTPTDAEELLRQADLAVYFAKQQGRNRVASAGDIDSELSESDTDARVWEYETRVRVLAERFAEQISRLGRKALTEFRTEADHDGLTEVYNRRYFDRRLSREIERALSNGTSLSLIMLDLDDFGAVNRTYGFPGGDSALRVFGTIVHKSIRTVDWAARYGGEEFCIVMPDTRVEDGVRVAHRLRDALKATHATAVDGREIKMTASIGVVQLDAATDPQLADPVRLVQAASDRVREAKNAGKDRVCS